MKATRFLAALMAVTTMCLVSAMPTASAFSAAFNAPTAHEATMTTRVTVHAEAGMAVNVTPMDPGNDAHGLPTRVEAGTEKTFYVYGGQDLRIHEVQPDDAPPVHSTRLLGNFGNAIAALKAGAKVARAGWNGKGMWLVLVHGTALAQLKPGDAYNRALGQDTCEILPHIDMWTTNADGRRAMLPGWLASQTDMLSEDWMLIA
jgi:Protein of unknown function (DUF2829)